MIKSKEEILIQCGDSHIASESLQAMQEYADQETAKLKEQIDFFNKANLFLMDELKEAKELLNHCLNDWNTANEFMQHNGHHGYTLIVKDITNFLNKTNP